MKSPYRARSWHWEADRFHFDANLSWVRWNEFGFKLFYAHNQFPGFFRNISRFKHAEHLWWQFLWFSGFFSLDWKRRDKDSQATDPAITQIIFGNLPADVKRLWPLDKSPVV